jgi:hypothetical protein
MRLGLLSALFVSSTMLAHNDGKNQGHPHFEYHSYLQMRDQGYVDKDLPAYKDNAVTGVKDHRFKDPKMAFSLGGKVSLNWHGNFNDSVSYTVQIDPKNFAGNAAVGKKLREISAHIKAHEMVHVKVGHMKVQQGGWDNMDWGVTDVWMENKAEWTMWPHGRYENALSFHILAFGRLELQLVEDAAKAGTANNGYGASTRNFNAEDTLTFAMGWTHDFSGFEPLVQFGMYDDFKSNYFTVGLKAHMQGVGFVGSFGQNSAKYKVDTKEHTVTATSFSVYLSYNIQDMVTPYFRFSQVDVKQEPTDSKRNVNPDKPLESSINGDEVVGGNKGWNDNGNMLSFGLEYQYTKNFMPYFALDMAKGKFDDQVKGLDKEKDYTEMYIRLGVTGTI